MQLYFDDVEKVEWACIHYALSIKSLCAVLSTVNGLRLSCACEPDQLAVGVNGRGVLYESAIYGTSWPWQMGEENRMKARDAVNIDLVYPDVCTICVPSGVSLADGDCSVVPWLSLYSDDINRWV